MSLMLNISFKISLRHQKSYASIVAHFDISPSNSRYTQSFHVIFGIFRNFVVFYTASDQIIKNLSVSFMLNNKFEATLLLVLLIPKFSAEYEPLNFLFKAAN